jgi:hypothetical protein
MNEIQDVDGKEEDTCGCMIIKYRPSWQAATTYKYKVVAST